MPQDQTDTNVSPALASASTLEQATYSSNVHLQEQLCAKLGTLGLRIEPKSRISGEFIFRQPAFFSYANELRFARMDAYSVIGQYTAVRCSSIGRYCSIAHKVEIGLDEVDTSALTTSWAMQPHNAFASLIPELKEERLQDLGEETCSRVCIGHDVWIGTHVCILKSVTIGTGAVIGAGSIITHDVPPYAVVAGSGGGEQSKGIVRRYRFSDELIADLLESKWWEYDLPRVQAMYQKQGRKLPFNDAKEFLTLLRNEDLSAWPKIKSPWLCLHPFSSERAQLSVVGDDYKMPHCADPMP